MLNINELCKKVRYDVLEAMCYLGFEYDVYATMPDVLIVDNEAWNKLQIKSLLNQKES